MVKYKKLISNILIYGGVDAVLLTHVSIFGSQFSATSDFFFVIPIRGEPRLLRCHVCCGTRARSAG